MSKQQKKPRMKTGFLCGFDKPKGGKCQTKVLVEGEKCHHHSASDGRTPGGRRNNSKNAKPRKNAGKLPKQTRTEDFVKNLDVVGSPSEFEQTKVKQKIKFFLAPKL